MTAPTPEIAPEVVERMVAVVRKIAHQNCWGQDAWRDELFQIVALLPEPVDPDAEVARQLYQEAIDGTDGCKSWEGALLRAIKHGRDLERGQ